MIIFAISTHQCPAILDGIGQGNNTQRFPLLPTSFALSSFPLSLPKSLSLTPTFPFALALALTTVDQLPNVVVADIQTSLP